MRFGPSSLEASIASIYLTSGEFVGSRMVFAQGTAPTGWTKDNTYNDYALRVTNGTVGSGGSINFSSVMTNQTLSGTATMTGTTLGATTLASTHLPDHYHSGTINGSAFVSNQSSPLRTYLWSPTGGSTQTTLSPTSVAWAGGSHTHSVSPATAPAGVSFDMSVKYIDVIIATKN